jgi:transcriptional regulator with XRE-family HTH domain
MARSAASISPISRNLRRLRKERGLSQYDLAEMSGLSQRMINHYENYASTPPVEKLKMLAKALNVKVAALLEDPQEQDGYDASLFDTRSLKKMRDILELPPNDRSFLYRTLSNLVRKNQLERASTRPKPETKENR